MIIRSRIQRRPTERTLLLDTQVGETQLQVALIDCDGVATPASLQRCLEEIRGVPGISGAGLDVRILELTDPDKACERAIRACFEVRAGTMLAFCYRGTACFREAARGLGLPLNATDE